MSPIPPSPRDGDAWPVSEFESFVPGLLARLFEHSSDRFLILGPEGSLKAASAAALRWRAEQNPEPSVGESWLEWLPLERFDEAAAALNSVARGSATAAFAIGENQYVELSALRDDRGDLRATLAYWRSSAEASVGAEKVSIPETRQRPYDLHATVARSEQRALGEFVIAIVHDLNNVLTSASSALRMIGRSCGPGSLFAIATEGMNVLDRGARLVRHLHDLARGSDADVGVVSVAKAFDGLSGLIRSVAGPGIIVELHAREDTGAILASPSGLESLILNLTANAFNVMPRSGRLEIKARNADASELPPGLLAGEFVRLEFVVACSGLGDGVLASVDATAAKRRGQGAGSSLVGAFEFAARAGGRCVVTNTGDGRSATTLFLPRTDASLAPATPVNCTRARPEEGPSPPSKEVTLKL